MPRSIDVLTSPSAPAWPTLLIALKSPLPSPNVMVPKQSFETRRPVLPSVAYSMSFFHSNESAVFLAGRQGMTIFFMDRSLLPMADQHVAACERELRAILLQA